MIKRLASIGIGGMLGAAAVHVWVPTAFLPSAVNHTSYADLSAVPRSSNHEPRIGAERLSAFMSVSSFADARDIRKAIEQLLARTPSRSRDTHIEALLYRYLELDPQSALRFAINQSIDRRVVVELFADWAQSDADAVWASLAEIRDLRLRRYYATELASMLASTSSDMERLAAIAGSGNRDGFIVDSLARMASAAPYAAIDQARDLVSYTLRTEAYRQIAREWVRVDASAALRYLPEIIDPVLRNTFHASIVMEWASIDPDAALEYMITADGQQLLSILPQHFSRSIAQLLAIHRPERALDISQRMPASTGQWIRHYASARVVESNLPHAMAQLESLPTAGERTELAALIATAYVRFDREAALQWAQTLDESSAVSAMNAILTHIARTDPLLAANVALEQGAAYRPTHDQLVALSSSDLLMLAEKLVGEQQSQQRATDVLLQVWSEQDPDGLWSWLLVQDNATSVRLVQSVAEGFARSGNVLPPLSIYSLPEGSRRAWAVSMATEYAQQEPNAAVEWLRAFEGDPAYTDWALDVANALARPGGRGNPMAALFPQPAAEILSTLQQPPRELTTIVASRWAIDEPAEALRWARNLSDPAASAAAVAASVVGWTIDDPSAAGQWALALPDGQMRTKALIASFAQQISTHGTVSRDVLNGIGTADDVYGAVTENSSMFTSAFTWLGSRNPDAAQGLLDAYVADPQLKQAIQGRIDGVQRTGQVMHRRFIVNFEQ